MDTDEKLNNKDAKTQPKEDGGSRMEDGNCWAPVRRMSNNSRHFPRTKSSQKGTTLWDSSAKVLTRIANGREGTGADKSDRLWNSENEV
jgi:hypothetical protein